MQHQHTVRRFSPTSSQKVAVKIISKDKCKVEDKAKLHREIDILKRIRHPNCIQFHEGA